MLPNKTTFVPSCLTVDLVAESDGEVEDFSMFETIVQILCTDVVSSDEHKKIL